MRCRRRLVCRLPHKGRQAVTLSGDGGLSMLMGDRAGRCGSSKLPVKVVVFNNGALGFVEQEMKAGGIDMYATEFVETNFAKVAEGVGISAWRVEKPEDVTGALTAAFAHDGPAVIDVKVARQELSLPPIITAAQAVGFNLYMVKAMLHGNGVDVLDMAKTNLWR